MNQTITSMLRAYKYALNVAIYLHNLVVQIRYMNKYLILSIIIHLQSFFQLQYLLKEILFFFPFAKKEEKIMSLFVNIYIFMSFNTNPHPFQFIIIATTLAFHQSPHIMVVCQYFYKYNVYVFQIDIRDRNVISIDI